MKKINQIIEKLLEPFNLIKDNEQETMWELGEGLLTKYTNFNIDTIYTILLKMNDDNKRLDFLDGFVDIIKTKNNNEYLCFSLAPNGVIENGEIKQEKEQNIFCSRIIRNGD